MAISDHIGIDTSGYTRTVNVPPPASESEKQLLPQRDSLLRFNAPFIANTFPSSDTLRGYHLGGQIPQYRIPVPAQASAQGASSTTTSTTVTTSTSTTTNNPAKSQTASVTTTVLNPDDQFQGVLTVAKSFVVLTVTVNNPARVRLYSTQVAQTSDLSRPITQGPGFGTEQGIIGDIYLDTTPVVWQAVDMQGANNDSPQSTSVYLTVDNIGVATNAIIVTVLYVPIQS